MPASEANIVQTDTMVPVRLRGHHFLCILTYRGFGYSPAFVANMTAIVDAIAAGRPVVLAEGPDDICNGLTPECRLSCDHDCSLEDTTRIDQLAIGAVADLAGLRAGQPVILDAGILEGMRQAFARGEIRAACQRCRWSEFCDTIASDGFSGTRLLAPAG